MSKRSLMISVVIVIVVTAAITAYYTYSPNAERILKFRAWMRDPASNPDWKLIAGSRCGSTPFLFPTDGFAGFLWGDSFGLRHTHQGIDIFDGTDGGVTPVISLAIGLVGPGARDAGPHLFDRIEDSDSQVRTAAALALGSIDAANQRLVPLLKVLSREDDILISSSALSLLHKLDPAAAAGIWPE